MHADQVGDALLKLPAVHALRGALPGARITWLAGGGASVFAGVLAPLVEGLVDEVKDRVALGRRWRELLAAAPTLDASDVIIDTQTRLRATLALRRLPHRIFISPAARFLLSDRRPAGPCRGSLGERLMLLFGLAAGRTLHDEFRLRLPGEYRAAAAELLPDGPCYVGLAPGSAVPAKRWPLERFIELARRQAARGRTPVFLLGPGERGWIRELRAAVPAARFPEQDAGDHGGPLLAMALAGRLAAGVANDSGTGHMIGIAGTPLVSLFARSNVEKFSRAGAACTVIQARGFGRTGMASIPVDAVAGAVDALLHAP